MLNKIKTTELTGATLDWAVAKCLHGNLFMEPYSTNWAQGGPIIEKEYIELITTNRSDEELWQAIGRGFGEDAPIGDGPTPLIAAMRCYVASKLGDTIEIPKELTQC